MSIDVNETTIIREQFPSKSGSLRARIFVILFLVAAITFIGISQNGASGQREWRVSALRGEIAMTESQLKNLIVSEKLTVYWTGPMAESFYTLNASKKNQIVLTYLPEKRKSGTAEKVTDTRVVGTYFSPSAFADSLNVATRNTNVSFKNVDGNLVFFPKERRTGVFVAIPNSNYQIEIFDPIPGQALSVASLRDQIIQIGK